MCDIAECRREVAIILKLKTSPEANFGLCSKCAQRIRFALSDKLGTLSDKSVLYYAKKDEEKPELISKEKAKKNSAKLSQSEKIVKL